MIRQSPPLMLLATVILLWLGSRMVVAGGDGFLITDGDGGDALASGDLLASADGAGGFRRPDDLSIAIVPTSRPVALLPGSGGIPVAFPAAVEGGPVSGGARRGALATTLVVRPARSPSVPTVVGQRERYARLQSLLLASRMASSPRLRSFAYHSDGGRVAMTGGLFPALRPRTAALTSRWSGTAWLALRGGNGGSDVTAVGSAAMLGGSQAGGRMAYALGAAGRSEIYARLVTAGRRMDSGEAAMGVAWRPLTDVPVQLAAERRQRVVGGEGRSAMAVMAVGGVSDHALPRGWRLDGYAAGGVVGVNRRDGFAEGSVRVSRPLAAIGRVTISSGAGVWAAAQPGVERVDAGPLLIARLDRAGPRLSLDWRQRLAGQAAPASGIALTLATDF